jgi:hypothetical protein
MNMVRPLRRYRARNCPLTELAFFECGFSTLAFEGPVHRRLPDRFAHARLCDPGLAVELDLNAARAAEKGIFRDNSRANRNRARS